MEIRTNAFILSSRESGEADLVLSFFTEDFGKIDARARGIRKLSSKLRSALSPLTKIQLHLYRNHGSFLVTGAAMLDDYFMVRGSVKALRSALIFTSLIKSFLLHETRDDRIFALLEDFFRRLTSGATSGVIIPVTVHSLWRLSDILGIAPDVERCVYCRSAPEAIAGEAGWSIKEGGMLCANCRTQDTAAFPLDPELLTMLQKAREDPVGADDDRGERVLRCLTSFLRWHAASWVASQDRRNMVL